MQEVSSEELKVILTQIALLTFFCNMATDPNLFANLWVNFKNNNNKKKAVHTQPPYNLTKPEQFLNNNWGEKNPTAARYTMCVDMKEYFTVDWCQKKPNLFFWG